MTKNQSELKKYAQQYSKRKKLVDLPTLLIILLMVMGFPLLLWLDNSQYIPSWLTLLLATILMNFSFTAWHEPSHKNFSEQLWINNIAGWIASFASIYPGYFARRREHLIHHKWEGIDTMDPVYQRIQTTGFFHFPFTLAKNIISPQKLGVPNNFLAISPWQKFADLSSNMLAVSIIITAISYGFIISLLIVWIFPRIIIFILHAYYICFFPHFISGGGYQLFRVQPDSLLWRIVTLNQHLHGIHHRWPWIPWYKYREVYHQFKIDLSSEKIEVI